MSVVISLTHRVKVDAEINLSEFIAKCKDELTAFGSDLDFGAPEWDVTDYYSRQGHRNSKQGRVTIHFTQRKKEGGLPFCSQLIGFAKGYIRSELYCRNSSAFTHAIAAFRALDVALQELKISQLSDCDASVFNRASAICRSSIAGNDDTSVGSALGKIARFLDKHGFVYAPLHDWKYIKVRKSVDTRMGPEFEKRRQKFLPSQEILDALPLAFQRAVEARDVLITSITAILCSAPERINEVLLLAENCEVEQTGSDGKRYLGLRWAGSKGARDHIKWLLPGMADVVRVALKRIRAISSPVREMARWYEQYPEKLFLPQDLEYLREKKILTLEEVGKILNLADGKRPVRKWITVAKIPYIYIPRGESSTGRVNVQAIYFSDLEKHIISTLPPGFPMFDDARAVKYSAALLVIPYGLFRSVPSRCMFEVVKYHHIGCSLGQNQKAGSKTVFQRVGIDPDGVLSMKSHQFRHWLNTLAQGANLSQVDIAKWSGRVSVKENESYDHVSSEERVLQIRAALGDHTKAIGILAEIPKNLPVTRAEFAEMSVPTAHMTLYGFCIHDFTALPCEMFRKCLDCREHVCIKGTPGRAERVQATLDAARAIFNNTKQAVLEEVYGAEDWLQSHKATVERLEQLIAILNDPLVPNGAIIQLGVSGTYSLSQGAILDRASLDRKIAAQRVLLGALSLSMENNS